MVKKINRATLLVELIRENGNENADLFDLLVPSRYGELYSLYCILQNSDVLEECHFDEPPVVEDDILIIVVNLPSDAQKRCFKYMESIDWAAEYLKKNHFTLDVDKKSDELTIRFVPIEA